MDESWRVSVGDVSARSVKGVLRRIYPEARVCLVERESSCLIAVPESGSGIASVWTRRQFCLTSWIDGEKLRRHVNDVSAHRLGSPALPQTSSSSS